MDDNIIVIIMLSSIILLMIIREMIKKKVDKQKLYNGLEVASVSCMGDKEFNEDGIDVRSNQKATLGMVVDGRGKNRAGELSSKLAINIFVHLFTEYKSMPNINYFFKRAFNMTNREILNKLADQNGGASIVVAIVQNDLLHYALVGNTKIAVFRNNELIPLSEGHTVNVIAEKGFYQGKITKQEALWALKQKRLFNYVGQDGFEEIEIYDVPVKLKKDDIIVLMSDGVHEYIGWRQLENIMNKKTSCIQKVEAVKKILKDDVSENKDDGSIVIIKYKKNKFRV